MTQSPERSSTEQVTLRPPCPAQLLVLEGRSVGQKFKLDGPATIGRSPDASVMLDDAEVSRLHARIVPGEAGGFLIEDLGSKNGTFVNGARVERRTITYGDKLRVGPRIVLELIAFDIVEDQIVQRQRFEAIGRLGVGIAHDLNNVLAALEAGVAYLDELPPLRSLGDAEVRECISDLSLAAARAGELTRGILSFARGRAATRAAVDVSALVSEVVRMLRHTLDQGIRIEPVIDAHMLVHGSQSELHQVLLNLCLNARDAMPDGGTLTIGATLTKDVPAELGMDPNRRAVVISVGDTGTGMDAQTQARIFEPFFTTKREGAGYGLGLATAREIVGLHGGHIVLETSIGVGSVFKVYLPMIDAQSARMASTEERAPLAGRRKLPHPVSVLLVDDEQMVRRSVARLLRQSGFEVTEAQDGAVAIGLYSRRAHELVLLDLDMPGINGEQTQAKLVSMDPHVRIIFASGHADPKREAAVRARGALGFLQKPYSLEALLTLVEEVMLYDSEAFEELTRPK